MFERAREISTTIEIFQLIVDYWEKSSSESTNIAKAKLNLGRCLWSGYEYKRAQESLEEGLKILQRGESPAKAEEASILVDIGWCQSEQGKFKVAIAKTSVCENKSTSTKLIYLKP